MKPVAADVVTSPGRAVRFLGVLLGTMLGAAVVAAPSQTASVQTAPIVSEGAPAAGEASTLEPAAHADSVAARRQAILGVARSFAQHTWRATEANALHGPDVDGVYVDTPDTDHRDDGWSADGELNVGVPYKWGGFSSLEEFDAGIAAGLPGGQLTDGVNLDASRLAVGVDCSGFVARCWELPFKQSTRSLGRLCFELDSYDELQPGDLINKYDAHAMLFVGYEGADRERVRVIEARLPKVMESVYPAVKLAEAGFRPFRYKPLDERWIAVQRSPPIFDALAGPTTEPDAEQASAAGHWEPLVPGDEAALDGPDLAVLLDSLANRLDSATPGDWTRYRVGNERSTLPMRVTRIVSAADETGIEVQTTSGLGSSQLQTVEAQEPGLDLAARLLGMRDDGQPVDELHLVETGVSPGGWVIAGRRFEGHRVVLKLEGSLTSRSQSIPLSITLEAVVCPDIPMEGVASYENTTLYHMSSGTATSQRLYKLDACGRG